MNRRIAIWMLWLIAIIVSTGSVYAQTTNPGGMKTIRLQDGEEVYGVSGEWDVLVENYGEWDRFRTYRNVHKITQEGRPKWQVSEDGIELLRMCPTM